MLKHLISLDSPLVHILHSFRQVTLCSFSSPVCIVAVSAVHQHLVKTKKRTSLAIILESGEPREVHHFATLLGYGACAINPYLALDTIHELIEEGMIKKDYYAAVEDYNHAVISGIVKIAAKM